MSENQLTEDFDLLGLPEKAGPEEIRRAYEELKNLYAEDSLATYSLLEEDERRIRLARIEEAYRRITENAATAKESSRPGAAETNLPRPAGADPSDQHQEAFRDSPGLFLKQIREQAGMTLREIAEQTNIGIGKLEDIENERFKSLPAPVFLRGFVIQFASRLGLANPDEIGKIYLEKFKETAHDLD